MNLRIVTLAVLSAGTLVRAAGDATALPAFTVYSSRVANQAPAATFAMPVSALRYEPRVDLQARNLVEGQADLTIRGGIFENSGFRIGALTILDPQTGHYLAEMPIAPVLLGAPEILTGVQLAGRTTNATVGAVDYGWRKVRTAGALLLAAGPHDFWRGELYQGYELPAADGSRLGADIDWARSASDGAIAFGDHRFERFNFRLQRSAATAETNLLVGYQDKFFGWPNLYTPFNSNESENLQTLLLMLTHRVELGGDDFWSAGVYHRRNKDDYAFNRFAPLGVLHPFQHTTWQEGLAVEGRRTVGAVGWNARGEVLADTLKSTSLRPGSRTMVKLAIVPERAWTDDGGTWTARAGATYDDSTRESGTLSPVFELERRLTRSAIRSLRLSLARTTQEPTYTATHASATSGLFRGNPALGREASRSIELAAVASLAGWQLEGTVFARRDDDLVDWTFRRGVTARSANAVTVDTRGVEMVARRSWRPVDLVLGYTLLQKDADYRGAAVDASFYALNYARHRLTLAATVRLVRGFELRVDNAARVQAENPLRTAGGERTVFTAVALAYRPSIWRGVELTAQVDNLWDSRFQEIPAVPASPRTWSTGVNYSW